MDFSGYAEGSARLVNTELNRKVGIRRISEATIKQLEQRLAAASSITRKR